MKMTKNNKKIIGIVIAVILLIALLIVAVVLIYKAVHKKSTPQEAPTEGPTEAPTSAPALKTILKVPDNRNTVYQIKGKLVRFDPDLYTGDIAKNSSQHPDFVKLVQSYGNKRRKNED